ncbi:MAG: HAMP domain-containing histidine kinase [Planctomycetaceae bacterium]|nr:HAMP domain-containing histidine kinase [Planctomycetaceae bacterium]
MKRPLHVWSVFGLVSVILVASAGWFSVRYVRNEEARIRAQLSSEQDQSIRLALWRMDSLVIPLIASEAAKTPESFESTGVVFVGDATSVTNSSRYVLLNFQACTDGSVTSPQAVITNLQEEEEQSQQQVAFEPLNTLERLAELQQNLNVAKLTSLLPEAPVISGQFDVVANGYFDNNGSNIVQNNAVYPPAVKGQRSEKVIADYNTRQVRLQQLAQQNAIDNYPMTMSPLTSIGTSQPLWLDGRLIIARRARVGGLDVVQGVWLDWDALRRDLLEEIDDLFPEARLEPIIAADTETTGNVLAAIPVALLVDDVVVARSGWSNQTVALIGAWLGLVVAIGSVGYLLYAVSSLSERRAAFVSAVTHELRTPLTTFQLYSDMLAEGVIQDPQQKKEYLETLRSEATRLGHLVENVLAYARLENRPRAPQQLISFADLMQQIIPRLKQRTVSIDGTFQSPTDFPEVQVKVDASVIEQILFNLIDNACKYGVRRENAVIGIETTIEGKCVHVDVFDNGPGIDPQVKGRLFQPFSKSDREAAATVPGLGLGLSLSLGLAKQQGGSLTLVDTSKPGARFRLELPVQATP